DGARARPPRDGRARHLEDPDGARRRPDARLRGRALHAEEAFLDPADAAMVEARRPAFLQAFLQRTAHIEGVPEPVVQKLVDHMTLTGDLSDLERVIRHMKSLEAAGLDEIALRLHDDPEESLRIIGERVVPEFG